MCWNLGFTSCLDQTDVSFTMLKLQVLPLNLAWFIKASPTHIFAPSQVPSWFLLSDFVSWLAFDLSHDWKHFWSLWTVADPGYHHWTCSSSPVSVLLIGKLVLRHQLCLWLAFSFLFLLQLGSQYTDKKFKSEVVLDID